ncbi:hypothetical protein Bca101_057755 [Brassica carinata]
MAEEVPLPSSVATFQPVNHLNLLQKRVICILRKRNAEPVTEVCGQLTQEFFKGDTLQWLSRAELVVVSLNTEEARHGGGGASCLCSPESEDNASWWYGG